MNLSIPSAIKDSTPLGERFSDARRKYPSTPSGAELPFCYNANRVKRSNGFWRERGGV